MVHVSTHVTLTTFTTHNLHACQQPVHQRLVWALASDPCPVWGQHREVSRHSSKAGPCRRSGPWLSRSYWGRSPSTHLELSPAQTWNSRAEVNSFVQRIMTLKPGVGSDAIGMEMSYKIYYMYSRVKKLWRGRGLEIQWHRTLWMKHLWGVLDRCAHDKSVRQNQWRVHRTILEFTKGS